MHSGSTSYNYIDAPTKPAFSAVAVTGGNAPRPSGTSWTMPSSVTAKAAPASGRLRHRAGPNRREHADWQR
ncbi:hypothetical protein M2302_006481 [Micromonospora sp. A200]|uniref:hypothetical protein n=1 Tax=Micromonospora sp. A200 TaxID=2940568 RepID=UPI0024770562|nr:hypothetical protein [Micromonospora sp. A200]MDH6466274.1 hypothetical protein [Micromonospora sp. A200]